MNRKITIGVAEDQKIYRDGLVSMLNGTKSCSVVLEASNGLEILAKMKGNVPDVMLLDYRMPE